MQDVLEFYQQVSMNQNELIIQIAPELLKLNCYFRPSVEAQAVKTIFVPAGISIVTL